MEERRSAFTHVKGKTVVSTDPRDVGIGGMPEFGVFMADADLAWDASPRAGLLVIGAFLDMILRRMLASYFVDDEKLTSKLLGKEDGGGTRPLAAFASRIDLAHALGLICKREADAAAALGGLRNKYAHRIGARVDEAQTRESMRSFIRLAAPDRQWHLADDGLYLEFKMAANVLLISLCHRVEFCKKQRRTAFPEPLAVAE